MLQEQMTIYDWLGGSPDTASGKTCQEPCPPASRKERTSKPSSRSSSVSQSRMLPMFLYLRKDGRSQEYSWGTPGALHGESTIVNSGVFRSVDAASVSLSIMTDILPPEYYLDLNLGEMPRTPNPTKLSEILEEDADRKYRLSSKACAGILKRAKKRGKELPEILKKALENQIEDEDREELHSEN